LPPTMIVSASWSASDSGTRRAQTSRLTYQFGLF
jgi:hypothetical protein